MPHTPQGDVVTAIHRRGDRNRPRRRIADQARSHPAAGVARAGRRCRGRADRGLRRQRNQRARTRDRRPHGESTGEGCVRYLPSRSPGAVRMESFKAPGRRPTMPVAAVLVIHENKGLNDWVRSVAGRFAGAGYSALAIDLLSEEGGTAHFTDPARPPPHWPPLRTDRFIADLNSGIEELQNRVPGRKIAVVGFCFGGGLVWQLLASGTPHFSAAVPFYGPLPDNPDFAGSKAPRCWRSMPPWTARHSFGGGGQGRPRACRAGPQHRRRTQCRPCVLQRHRTPLQRCRRRRRLAAGAGVVWPATRLSGMMRP